MTGTATEDAETTISEIIEDLTLLGTRFPREAMQAAIERREAITPELLRVLERVEAAPDSPTWHGNYMLLTFAMYLLAQFREQRAYRPLVSIFSAPGETPFDLIGDSVCEGLSGILGSVYDGDPGPLQRLVENESANEYVRAAAVDTFIVLERSGQMPREEVAAYYRQLLTEKLPREPMFVWNELVCAVSDLPAPELLDDVRRAFADDLVESSYVDLEYIEQASTTPKLRQEAKHAIVTDAIAEMEWWACFNPSPAENTKLDTLERLTAKPARPPAEPRVKTGRNDPCPCGSGRKYKKCCGSN